MTEITIDVPTFEIWRHNFMLEFQRANGDGLNLDFNRPLPGDLEGELKKIYDYVVDRIEWNKKHYPETTHIYLQNWYWGGGAQISCNGAFENENRPLNPFRVNWHGQNTSRMLYGFGCVYEVRDRKFWTNSI